MTNTGWVVVLNGAPRSGKSSIARALVERGGWVNYGVDAAMAETPDEVMPGIGLRPGGERPDIEAQLPSLYRKAFTTIVERARTGENVAVDLGIHDDYSTSLGLLPRIAGFLVDHGPTLFVGVRCPIDEIMRRRAQADPSVYAQSEIGGAVPAPVRRWQSAVHDPGVYDLEIDTSTVSPGDAARQVLERLKNGPGQALPSLATQEQGPLLISDRVRLRGWADGDIRVRAALGRNRDIVRAFGGDSPTDMPMSAAEAQVEVTARFREGPHWVIADTDDQFIGVARLTFHLDHGNTGRFAIGILDPQRLGQGLGTEATMLVVAYGFRTYPDMDRIDLVVLVDNERAIAAYRKAGFVEVERIERTLWRDERWYDDLLMRIERPNPA